MLPVRLCKLRTLPVFNLSKKHAPPLTAGRSASQFHQLPVTKLGKRQHQLQLQVLKEEKYLSKRNLSYSTIMCEKVTMIVDCDAGVDDAVALMMALSQPNVDMIGITCVNGNVVVDKVSVNVLRVLQKMNRLDVPVFVGSPNYILGHPNDASDHHGDDGLGDVPSPEAPPSLDLLQSQHAVQALIRLANERPKEITLVAIGPLTNVALAMRLDPMFTSKLKEMVIMGGNIKGRGTGFFTAEFNFGSDPEAAHIVLQDIQCPTIIMPLETCMDHAMSLDWYDKLTLKNTPRADFMHAINFTSVKRCKEKQKLPAHMIADSCAIVVAVRKDAIEESTHSVCKVELQGQYTRGQMVTNKLNTRWIPAMEGVEVEVVTKFDMKVLYKMLDDATD